jgi:molecular chaperone GrpE
MSDEVENDTVAAPDDAVTEVVVERTDVERQRDEYLDALQRLQADFENYRKRVARSSMDAAERAAGEVVVKMLPVLDAFDLAAAHFLSAPSEEAEALDQARGLLLDALSKEGLQRIDAVGVEFDPQIHDAVAHVAGDDGPVVEQVLRAGYRWKGSVLRPAMVKVRG